jgi:hypothetical protein
MSEIEAEELVKLRRGIEELMGQCILKLQSYELRMKHFLATPIRIKDSSPSYPLAFAR